MRREQFLDARIAVFAETQRLSAAFAPGYVSGAHFLGEIGTVHRFNLWPKVTLNSRSPAPEAIVIVTVSPGFRVARVSARVLAFIGTPSSALTSSRAARPARRAGESSSKAEMMSVLPTSSAIAPNRDSGSSLGGSSSRPA